MTLAIGSGPRLDALARRLGKAFERLQRRFAHKDLWLSKWDLHQLAHVLLELNEDVVDDAGLWAAYERHNRELFGSALPLTPGSDLDARIRHLLWVLYPVFVEGLDLSPTHAYLERMAHCTVERLRDEGLPAPGDTGEARTMLAGPNERAEDVKRKLVWVGTHSYMFRALHARYMAEHAEPEHRIDAWDDFLCQESTPWSGLGVIDVLAAALDLPATDRDTLKTWNLRHVSGYRVLAAAPGSLRLESVVSEREYRVRLEMDFPAKVGQLIFGSLVPWRGDWYWSGAQRVVQCVTDEVVATIRRQLIATQSQIVCRSWPEHEARVRERAAEFHAFLLALHGDDLVSYPDGLSMAADFERELRLHWESKPVEARERTRVRHGLRRDRPALSFPDHVVQHREGLGVFLNPDEGKEIMLHFTTLVSGLRKAGGALTSDEAATIRGFVHAGSVSPQFVRRVVRDHGAESIKAAFSLDRDAPACWLEYLLRRHKGHFYRRRFPTVSLVD